MTHNLKLLAIAVPALLLGGCGTENRGMESVHQPIVQRAEFAFDVATSGNDLAPGEAQRLAGWLASLRLGYGDRLSVDDASGYRSGVRDAVSAQAARYGMLVSDDVPVTRGPIAPGTARVIVSRMTASVPGCPDFSRMGGSDLNANTGSNQGCAVNTNLAAMIARPEDLVRGVPGSGVSDTTVSNKAIGQFRSAAPTGAGGVKSETTKGGN